MKRARGFLLLLSMSVVLFGSVLAADAQTSSNRNVFIIPEIIVSQVTNNVNNSDFLDGLDSTAFEQTLSVKLPLNRSGQTLGLFISACGGGEVITSNGTHLNCVTDATGAAGIVDTNATTECGTDEFLDGDGDCIPISTINITWSNATGGSFDPTNIVFHNETILNATIDEQIVSDVTKSFVEALGIDVTVAQITDFISSLFAQTNPIYANSSFVNQFKPNYSETNTIYYNQSNPSAYTDLPTVLGTTNPIYYNVSNPSGFTDNASARSFAPNASTITCSGTDKVSAYDNVTGLFTCTADDTAAGGSGIPATNVAFVNETNIFIVDQNFTAVNATRIYQNNSLVLDSDDGYVTGAHTTDTGPVPDCGTGTFQDGDGNCVTIASVNITYSNTTDTTRSDEEITDLAGGMVTGNTETGITVTFQDGDDTIDFVVDAPDFTNLIYSNETILNSTIFALSGNLTSTTCSGDDKVSAINIATGVVTCSADTDTIENTGFLDTNVVFHNETILNGTINALTPNVTGITCTGDDKVSAIDTVTGVVTCTTDQLGGGGSGIAKENVAFVNDTNNFTVYQNFTAGFDSKGRVNFTDPYVNDTRLMNLSALFSGDVAGLFNNLQLGVGVVSDSEVSSLSWSELASYPAACGTDETITALGDTITCSAISILSTAVSNFNAAVFGITNPQYINASTANSNFLNSTNSSYFVEIGPANAQFLNITADDDQPDDDSEVPDDITIDSTKWVNTTQGIAVPQGVKVTYGSTDQAQGFFNGTCFVINGTALSVTFAVC